MSTRRFNDPFDPATDKVIGPYTGSKVAFHGSTATSQRASASLSAGLSIFASTGASIVAATTATITGLVTFTTTQMASLIDAVAELRTMVTEKGLHKGGA